MYNFTSFAMTLNELEPGMERLLPPTDCRLRPDIKAMEDGDVGRSSRPKETRRVHPSACCHSCFCSTDAASREKERLEEKQRAARRERSEEEEEWTTRCVFAHR